MTMLSDGEEPLAPLPASPSPTRIPPDWGELARSLTLLGGAVSSTALAAVTSLVKTPVREILASNAGTPTERTLMAIGVAAGGLPALVGFVAVAAKPSRLAAVKRLSDRMAPLTAAAALPALFTWRGWAEQPLTYLVLLTIVGFGLRAAFTRFFSTFSWRLAELEEPSARARWAPLAAVAAGSIAYAIYFAFYSIRSHHRFQTAGFDLGIYDNLMFNAMHGHPFRATVLFGADGGNNLASHAEFAVIPYIPLYALYPRAENLLVLQATVLGAAAIPLYFFASQLLPRWTAAILSLGYLLYAPLHGPTLYDFHWLPLALFFHFSLYWGIVKRRWWFVAVMLVALYATREDIAVGLSALGVFLLLSGARPRFGALLVVVSASWFVVDKFVIMAWAGRWWFSAMYKDLMAGSGAEKGYGSVIKTLLVNPTYTLSTLLKADKAAYLLHLLAPLAMLPARRIGILLLASSAALFTLLTTGYGPTIQISFQYTTHWMPYLFGATVLALNALGKEANGWARQCGAVAALAVCIVAHSYVFGAVMQHNSFVAGFGRVQFAMSDTERQTYADFRALAAKIPKTASVAATENLVAHVSSRTDAYTLRSHHGDADFLLFTKHAALGSDLKKVLTDVMTRNSYGFAGSQGDFYLFQKNLKSDGTSAALATLGLPPSKTGETK
jgi:uncharacterized membrane protein